MTIKELRRAPRILTTAERHFHVVRCKERDPHQHNADYWDLLGDIAAVNSNYYHNAETGHLELYSDTPDWVRAVAKKRK